MGASLLAVAKSIYYKQKKLLLGLSASHDGRLHHENKIMLQNCCQSAQ